MDGSSHDCGVDVELDCVDEPSFIDECESHCCFNIEHTICASMTDAVTAVSPAPQDASNVRSVCVTCAAVVPVSLSDPIQSHHITDGHNVVIPAYAAVELKQELRSKLSVIQSTIASLVDGKAVVKQTIVDTRLRLQQSLAEYQSMIDGIVQNIRDTADRVKQNMTDAVECQLKRLDAQCDEIDVSISQIEGFSAMTVDCIGESVDAGKLCEVAKVTRKNGLLEMFRGPVCAPTLVYETPQPELKLMLTRLTSFAAKNSHVRSALRETC